MLIDTHCHLNFNAFAEDGEAVIKRTIAKNIWMINVGSQYSTSQRAVEIASRYPKGVYAAVGLHPIHLFETYVDEIEIPFKSRVEDFNYDQYKKLAQKNKVVAIGECGLDYYHLSQDLNQQEAKTKQKEVFLSHLELARELKMPIILHCRGSIDDPLDAYLDLLAILKQKENKIRGVVHCFAADLALAKEFLLLGLKVSFTGIITFKNAGPLQEVIKSLPLEEMLVETDAPYIAPEPFRGKRNEPAFVEYIVRKIAEIKETDFSEVQEITNANAKALFNLPS